MLILDTPTLQGVVDRLRREPFCALDVEFVWNSTYRPTVALIQLAAPDGTVWLLDPLAVEDPTPLAALLSEPGCVKILHSGSQDLAVFLQYVNTLPTPLLDTQIAAALVGRGYSLSYAALVEQCCGVTLAKTEQRSDWTIRPLTARQLEYAEHEVSYLVKVYEALRADLESRGRWEWALDEGVALCESARDSKPAWKTVSGGGRLRPRQLAVLMELAVWREQRARDVNRPVRWVLADDAMLALATLQPRSHADLDAISLVPPKVRQKGGAEILACITAGLAVSESELPRLPRGGRLSPEEQKQLDRAIATVRQVAESSGVPPELLGPRRLVESLLRANAAGTDGGDPELFAAGAAKSGADNATGSVSDALATHPLLTGWRGSLLTGALATVLTL